MGMHDDRERRRLAQHIESLELQLTDARNTISRMADENARLRDALKLIRDRLRRDFPNT